MPRLKCLSALASIKIGDQLIRLAPARLDRPDVAFWHLCDLPVDSGVPWASNAYFPKENVRLDGPNKVYTRTSDAGTRINHHFCPNCGVTVCWARETGSTRFGIPVGTFNDPSLPAPSMSVWEKRRYAWSPQVGDVKHWDTQPPPP